MRHSDKRIFRDKEIRINEVLLYLHFATAATQYDPLLISVLDLELSLSSISGQLFIRGQPNVISMDIILNNPDHKELKATEGEDNNFNFTCWVSSVANDESVDLDLGSFVVEEEENLTKVVFEFLESI